MEDVAFGITVDSGKFESKGLLLLRSIREHYPDSPILTFIPGGTDEMNASAVNEFEEKSTVRIDEPPLEDYPHTAFQRAFEMVVEEFDAKYYAAIDTDCVVLDKITLPRKDADLYAAPMYMGVWKWQSVDGVTDDWKKLFDHYEIPVPDQDDVMKGATDSTVMWPPYYNSGVMVTTDEELPTRFRKMNVEMFGGDLTDTDPAIETEQVALALLANNPGIDFCELTLEQNWMMGGFLYTPDNVEILHYQFFDTLSTLRNPKIKTQIEGYGVHLTPRWSDYPIRLLSYGVFRGGRIFPPNVQRSLASKIQPVFDLNSP